MTRHRFLLKLSSLLFLLWVVFVPFVAKAQFAVTPQNNAVLLAEALTGKGVSLSNVTLNCPNGSSGLFSGGLPNTNLTEGVVLTTGLVDELTFNPFYNMSTYMFAPPDPDLNTLVSTQNFDACVLEFDIRPLGDTIEFNFVFASEEYPEYVCSQYNDVFAFFLTGPNPNGPAYNKTNIAKIPGTNLPVAINTVNPGVAGSAAAGGNCNSPGESKAYSSLYINNNNNGFVMDGMTRPLTAKAAVVACATYRLKFAIQDAGDGFFDSGVFLTSIRSNSVTVSPFTNVPLPQDTADIFEDSLCNRAGFRFELDSSFAFATFVYFDVGGTATNGVDYVAIPDSIIIPAGTKVATLPIVPLQDTLKEGKETVILYLKGSCNNDYIDSVFIYIYDDIEATAGPDTNLCPLQPLTLNASANTDFPWIQLLSYQWFPSQYVSDATIQQPQVVKPANQDSVILFFSTQVMNCKSDTDTVVVFFTRKPGFSVNAGLDDTICLGQNVTLNVAVVDSNSTAPFSFAWNPSAPLNDSTLQNPVATPTADTKFKVKVEDRFGCTLFDSTTISVSTPPDFVLTRSLDTICPSFPVQLSFVLQSGVYDSVVWQPSSGLNAVANKNATNTQVTPSSTQIYRLTAWNSGCFKTDSILIVVDDALSVDAGSDTVICLGNSLQLNATVSGNRGPVNYIWQPAVTLNNAGIANPLATPVSPVTYVVTASSVGCVKSDSVYVNSYQINASLGKTDVSCFAGNNGALTATAVGGALPYGYTWSNSAPDLATQNSLPAGFYSLTVNDANGCTATANAQINQPDSIQFGSVVVNDAKCFQSADGSVSVSVSGGTPGYSYLWLPSKPNSNSIQQLTAGNYSLTVSDANGCLRDTQFVVSEPAELLLDTQSVHVRCFGGNDGIATVLALGGVSPYTYQWSNGNTLPVNQNLQAGQYAVTVTDANQCSKANSFIIFQPPAVLANAAVLNNVSCFGENDGAAFVQSAQGGTAPFTFAWSNGQTGDTASLLSANTYALTITDNNNCTGTTTVAISQPDLLTATTAVVNVKCFGGNDGSIACNASGGTLPYTFLWNNGQNTATATMLPFGAYNVLITDHNGCTTTASADVLQPDSLGLSALDFAENCIGSGDGKITAWAFGGVPPYGFSSLSLSGNTALFSDTLKNLSPGVYTIRVTDNNNCIAQRNVTVGSQKTDAYDYLVEMPSCFGVSYQDGSIAVRGLESENAPFSFSLSPDSGYNLTGFFNKLGAGFYPVYIKNKNGCDTMLIVEVPSPAPAQLMILPNDTTVNIGDKVMFDVTIQPFSISSITSYRWSPQQGLSCVECRSPIVTTYDDETVYELTVAYNKGCIAKAQTKISTEANPEIFVPNMFSPNNDGINDRFFVYGYGIRDFSLKIFNRWGEKVFESTEQSEGWDGFFKNQLMEPGAYVYLLEVVFLNNRTSSKTGSVTLVR